MDLHAEVDLGRICRNLESVRARTGVRVLLMVKADAYGHGMREVARAAEPYADFFGVATVGEGEALRADGRTLPVLAAVCPAEELARAAACGLTAAVADGETLRALADMPAAARPPFHVKFDTGMHRLGFPAEDVGEVLGFLRSRGLKPDGVYSHFREPDEEQSCLFRGIAGAFRAEYPAVTAHMASSSSLGMKDSAYDMVRIGHAAYLGAMTVKSRVIAVRKAKAGECVGYGRHVLPRDTSLAVVFGGYFDGVYRESPSPVLIGDTLCPAVGSVCMDMFAVDTGDAEVRVGDEAVLLGGALTAEKVAAARGTTDYEVMTCWQGRVKRCYVDERGSEKTGERRGGENERRGAGMGVGCDH